jgi:peptidoglycan/xylan/chitin deacetylase (PgdA/CDA1 family)
LAVRLDGEQTAAFVAEHTTQHIARRLALGLAFTALIGYIGYQQFNNPHLKSSQIAAEAIATPASTTTLPLPTVTKTVTKNTTKTVTVTKTVRPKPSAPSVSSLPAKATILTPGMSAFYPGLSSKQVNAIEHCGNQSDRVLLTFDDYSSPDHLQKITNILTANHIGAIFFPISKQFSEARAAQLRQQGFWVGNHSTTHANLHKLDNAQIKAEIAGGIKSDLFRPPYGATYTDKLHGNKALFDRRVYDIATDKSLGKRVCTWTVDTRDWDHQSAKQIVNTVKTYVHPGSVVLMHMVDGYKTVDALPAVIEAVHAKGLKFCVKPDGPTSTHIPASLPCEK